MTEIRPFAIALFAPALVLGPLTQVGGIVVTRDDLADEYYTEEPPFSLGGRTWFGVFTERDSSWLELATPEWVREGSQEDRVFRLSTGERAPILLLADVPGVGERAAVTAAEFTTTLSDRESMEVSVGGTIYSLTVRPFTPPECGATISLSDGRGSQEIYSTRDGEFGCDEPHFSVHWAGDLDGDNRLDLVTTFSAKYSYHPRRVYLSSAAGPGQILSQVAFFDGSAS